MLYIVTTHALTPVAYTHLFAVEDYCKPMVLYGVIDLMFAAVCLIIFLFDVFAPKKANQPKSYTVSQYIK